jgi:hypothetical protein
MLIMQGIRLCMDKRILITTIIKSILFYKRNATKKNEREENNTRSNIGSQSLALAERVK